MAAPLFDAQARKAHGMGGDFRQSSSTQRDGTALQGRCTPTEVVREPVMTANHRSLRSWRCFKEGVIGLGVMLLDKSDTDAARC